MYVMAEFICHALSKCTPVALGLYMYMTGLSVKLDNNYTFFQVFRMSLTSYGGQCVLHRKSQLLMGF